MGNFVRRLARLESGQGLSEYLIIVALVAMAAIGVVTVFGRDIRELFAGTTDSLAGNQASNTALGNEIDSFATRTLAVLATALSIVGSVKAARQPSRPQCRAPPIGPTTKLSTRMTSTG